VAPVDGLNIGLSRRKGSLASASVVDPQRSRNHLREQRNGVLVRSGLHAWLDGDFERLDQSRTSRVFLRLCCGRGMWWI